VSLLNVLLSLAVSLRSDAEVKVAENPLVHHVSKSLDVNWLVSRREELLQEYLIELTRL
jgi:hypothetical protein